MTSSPFSIINETKLPETEQEPVTKRTVNMKSNQKLTIRNGKAELEIVTLESPNSFGFLVYAFGFTTREINEAKNIFTVWKDKPKES